jgi:branched-chain amino acid transport system substrate-binding protein
VKKVLLGILGIIVIISIILSGCSAKTTAPTSSTAQPTTPAAAAKTLKIGITFWLGSAVGLDALHGIELMAEEDNKNGGIDIGGEKYKIDLISYDTEGNQTSEVAAINRLIFEDKVNYIITVGQFQGAWLKTTEENKVLVMSQDMVAPVDLAPTTHYSFNPTFQNPEINSKLGWYIKNYPDLCKNYVTVYLDNQFGHMVAMMSTPTYKAFGVTTSDVFFPAQQVDVSAVATKVVNMNPTTVTIMTADSNTDAITMDTLRKAGYKGQFFMPTNNALDTFKQFVSVDVLEGFITGMSTTESDPAATATAQHFKELWIAKYGNWTAPTIISTGLYQPLITALKKAGSLDTAKVSDTLASGLEFSSVSGDGKMISRPDIGNERTVDSISTYYVKQIVDGKIKLLATISSDEALELFRKATSASGPPPGAGGPPPGP